MRVFGGQAGWEFVAESIPHMVWLAAPDGSNTYVNHQLAEFSGGSVASHGGWQWVALVHPDDVAETLAGWNAAVRSGRQFETELRLRRLDGEYRLFVARAEAVRGANGEVERWVGTATDIEAPRVLERALLEAEGAAAESHALLAALQEAAPVALGFVDREFCLLQANEEFAGIGGKLVRGHIGNKIADALPNLWPQIESALHEVLESGEAIRYVRVIGTATGEGRQFHEWAASCYPVTTDDQLVGVGIVAVDVTALKLATAFGSAVMAQVEDGVYAVDSSGCLLFMNLAASGMLGWSEDELRGQHMHDLTHFQRSDGTPIPRSQCALLAAEQRLVTRGVDEMFTRKDGSLFRVAWSSVPLGIGAEVEGTVIVFHEIPQPGAAKRPIRLLIIDSRVMVSEAFQMLLGTQEGIEVVGTASTSADGLAEANRLSPDVVLIDMDLPDLDGIQTAAAISETLRSTSIILVTQSHDADIVGAALRAGCAGVLDKDRAWVELVGAVRAAFRGQTILSPRVLQRVLPDRAAKAREGLAFLTNRELEVLSCISEGMTNRAVADALGVTSNTVRNHVQRILYKLNVHSKLEAIVFAQQDPDGFSRLSGLRLH